MDHILNRPPIAVDGAVQMERLGEDYWFLIEFPLSVPPTDSDIVLDLGNALEGAGLVVPMIRFRQVHWSETEG